MSNDNNLSRNLGEEYEVVFENQRIVFSKRRSNDSDSDDTRNATSSSHSEVKEYGVNDDGDVWK
jgi:hypothetical protein